MGRGVTSRPWGGIRGVHYAWLRGNRRHELREMEETGEIDAYMERFMDRYLRRRATAFREALAALGCTDELKAADYGEWQRRTAQAGPMADELAMRDVVESLCL